MRTIEKTVYTYDELSETAKEKAKEWYRSASKYDNYWSESVISDAEEVAKILGIDFDRTQHGEAKIYWTGFWSQGDGACFEADYRYAKNCKKKIREYAPKDNELHRIADALTDIARRSFYRIRANTYHRGHYYHSHTMRLEAYECTDEQADELKSVLRDFADWIHSSLEAEYNYQNSDDIVAENIMANEYEFDENGRRA